MGRHLHSRQGELRTPAAGRRRPVAGACSRWRRKALRQTPRKTAPETTRGKHPRKTPVENSRGKHPWKTPRKTPAENIPGNRPRKTLAENIRGKHPRKTPAENPRGKPYGKHNGKPHGKHHGKPRRRRPVAGAGGGTRMAEPDGTDRRCVARVAAGRLVLACPGWARGMGGVFLGTRADFSGEVLHSKMARHLCFLHATC